jgi:hypothetical protein
MLIKKILNHVKTNNLANNTQNVIQGVLSYLSDTEDGKILMAKMLVHSQVGVEAMLDVLGCDRRQPDNTKKYLIAQQYDVKAADMVEFRGFTAKGFPIPPGSVTVEVMQLDQCESCGVSCTDIMESTNVIDGSYQMTCNHCRTYGSIIESSTAGNISVCQSCAKFDCSHNPKKMRMVQSERSQYSRTNM